MTTYSITLRCRKTRGHDVVHKDYRVQGWTREEAIRRAKEEHAVLIKLVGEQIDEEDA